MSVLARRHGPLASLRQDAAARTGRPDAINPIAADYGEIPTLAMGLRSAAIAHGPISLAACYIHTSAPMAPIVIADTIATPGKPCRYIHIVGSASPDDLRQDQSRDEILSNPGIAYTRIILGFVTEPAGTRWLTDDEICTGILRAVPDPRREQIIGVVTPWESHPPL